MSTELGADRRAIDWVVDVHAGDAAVIAGQLLRLRAAPHMNLAHLARFEARLSAHLEGLAVAGATGRRAVRALLADDPHPGAVAAGAMLGLELGDANLLDEILVPSREVPGSGPAIAAALSWADASRLRGVVARLALSEHAHERVAAIRASCSHLAPARAMLSKCLADDDPVVVAAALEGAATLGMSDLVRAFDTSSRGADVAVEHARASALLGFDHEHAIELCTVPGPLQIALMGVALRAVDPARARSLLDRIAAHAPQSRALIAGAGIVGDPVYVSWLIGRMQDAGSARIAGESFATITGVDLSRLDLERRPPEGAAGGPDDDPSNADVEIDADDGLAWPDPDRVAEWWKANSSRFPAGQRLFMGRAVQWDHCTQVLAAGFQRQRAAAAVWRCVLRPGTPLFPVDAPVARQRALLGAARSATPASA